jgi:hypothetical protein
VQGFNAQALRDLIGLTGDGAGPLSPDMLLDRYRLIFGAAKLAITQIPDDKLDWVTPGRERTLRQLTWHIFDRAEEFAELLTGGEYTENRVEEYMTLANACRTGRDIAAYGDQVLEKVEYILTSRKDSLDVTVKTYFGEATMSDLLTRALSMAAFRLSGTYRYMRMLGIEPLQPLGPEDFAGLVVPPGSP